MKKLFETSGARGVTGTEITLDLALNIAAFYGELMQTHHPDCQRFVVAHDNRHGARALALSAISGLLFAGYDVDDLGCVSTGVFTTHIRAGLYHAGGILITGSHMPPERIGIIPMLPNGHYADTDATDLVAHQIANKATPRRVLWNQCGNVHVIDPLESEKRYLDAMESIVRPEDCCDSSFGVLIDAANGTAGRVTLRLLEQHYNHEVTPLHTTPKPIPDRPSECRAENCGEAIARMRQGGLALGACLDGDADRVIIITEKGEVLPDSVIGAIFASHLLKPSDIVVTPVNASRLIEVVAEKQAARVVYCRIGQPATGTTIRLQRAAFAYEEAAGKFGFGDFDCCYDGPLAVCMMLKIMAQTGKSLSQLAAEVPKFFQATKKFPVPDALKDAVVTRAIEAARDQLYSRVKKEVYIDGTKFCLDDGSWILLRPSGTEPFIRCYADSQDKERTDGLITLGGQCITDAIAAVRKEAASVGL